MTPGERPDVIRWPHHRSIAGTRAALDRRRVDPLVALREG